MKKLLIILASALLGTTASAATTGFGLTISGDTNLPTLMLTNTGDLGEITGFDVTMGMSGYNFDGVEPGTEVASPGVSTTLTSGDRNNSGGVRVTTLSYTSTGFLPGSSFSYAVDIDPNFFNRTEDYRIQLLPGGSFTVHFSGGLTNLLTVDLSPAAFSSAPYVYSASVSTAAVPLPAGGLLLMGALGALGIARRKSRVA